MKRIVWISFALITLLSSCIGEDFLEDSGSMQERLSIVSDPIGNDTLLVGDTLTYKAKFYNINGVEESRSVNWNSSRPAVAMINGEGLITALSEGVTNIEVQSGDLSDSRLLIVQQLERLEITSSTTSLFLGDSATLTANYYDANGAIMAATINWSSSNTSVLSIDANGKIRALGVGMSEVTASANGITSDPFEVSIVNDTTAVAVVSINADTTQLEVGEQLQFTATVKNINGNELPNQSVQWFSSDPAVVSVNSSGLATAADVGSATISASASNVNSNDISILVSMAIQTSRSGNFSGRNGYSVSGTVSMDVQSSGSLRLNFTNFSTQNGPGLYIYLSNSTNGGFEIARLPQTSGNFSIDLPANISIDDYNFILIWCKPFGATFGAAQLN